VILGISTLLSGLEGARWTGSMRHRDSDVGVIRLRPLDNTGPGNMEGIG